TLGLLHRDVDPQGVRGSGRNAGTAGDQFLLVRHLHADGLQLIPPEGDHLARAGIFKRGVQRRMHPVAELEGTDHRCRLAAEILSGQKHGDEQEQERTSGLEGASQRGWCREAAHSSSTRVTPPLRMNFITSAALASSGLTEVAGTMNKRPLHAKLWGT